MIEHRHTNCYRTTLSLFAFCLPRRQRHYNAKKCDKELPRNGARTELILLVLIFRRGKTWHMVLTHELPRHSIGGTLFGCRRWSGVLLFFRNSRHIIPYATLLDVTIFSHTAFHHPFLIGHPFIFALFHKFFGTRCVCEWCGGGRTRPGSLRKCGEMLDCYSCQYTTNEAKVIFHLWRRLQSFQSHPKTNENLCRLFLPVEPRSRISGGACRSAESFR